MSWAVRICMLAIFTSIAAALLRKKNESGAFLLAISACAFIAFILLQPVKQIYTYAVKLIDLTGVSRELYAPLFKTVALTICIRICGELCRDAGESAMAAKVEIAGAVAGAICILPLVEQALKSIGAI